MEGGTHSDTDSEYIAHSPSPALPPNRPPGDIYEHLDFADGSPKASDDDDSDDASSQFCDYQPIPERVGDFVVLAKHRLDATGSHMHVVKWRSEKTGLSVIWADTPDLISTFSTTVVTEIFNSSGVPHTLEHLTFTASEHYPFSNVLDAIASRCMTQGVNAATDVDNTTYTVESASEEGILELVPVYLDHIFFPIVNESIFKTEIYHINGKGEEGGTVFAEMQGTQGSKEDAMQLAQQQALYDFKNAYRFETGGLLPHLRTLTERKITDYHEKAYVPQNVTVVVTGRQINPERLLDTISRTTERDLESAGLARGPHPPDWIRPIVGSSTAYTDPLIEKDKTILVPYADTDTSTGEIQISFVGPRIRDTLSISALGVLGDYLAGSPHSVLNRKFVEISGPACAGISFSVAFRDPTVFTLTLSSVEASRLSTLAGILKMVFKQLCRVPIDMAAIQLVIKQQVIGLERARETAPGVYVKAAVLQDIIYGKGDGSDFSRNFNDLEMLKKLSKWNELDWLDLFKEFMVERHSIVLIGTPTPHLVQENAEADASRVATNIRRLGPEGLARLERELRDAERENNHPPPRSLVESYTVPDFRKILWLPVGTGRSNGVGQRSERFRCKIQDIIDDDGGDLPVFVQFDHVSSSFVTVSAFLHGPAYPILPLYVDTFFTMPIKRPRGRTLSWDQVSRKIDRDLTSCSVLSVHEGVWISITALKEDYAKTVSWLSDFLYGTVFDVERLTNLVKTRLQGFASVKGDGSRMAKAAIRQECFTKASFETPTNPIYAFELYPELERRLKEDPQSVVRDLEKMRDSLLDPRAMRFSVVGDMHKLENPSSTWLDCFEPIQPFPASELARIFRPRELVSKLGSRPHGKAVVYQLDSSESTYLVSRSRCPDWNHPDFAALDVACSILSQPNGLLWNVTRTAGLAYGTSIGQSVEHGFVSLDIYRSPNAISALSAVRDMLVSVKSGKFVIESTELEAAKSEIAFESVAEQNTPATAASNSFFDTVILNKPHGYSKRYLTLVEHVSIEDVRRVIDTWIVPLVSPRTSVIGATASPAKMASLVGGLTKLGYDVDQRHF